MLSLGTRHCCAIAREGSYAFKGCHMHCLEMNGKAARVATIVPHRGLRMIVAGLKLIQPAAFLAAHVSSCISHDDISSLPRTRSNGCYCCGDQNSQHGYTQPSPPIPAPPTDHPPTTHPSLHVCLFGRSHTTELLNNYPFRSLSRVSVVVVPVLSLLRRCIIITRATGESRTEKKRRQKSTTHTASHPPPLRNPPSETLPRHLPHHRP